MGMFSALRDSFFKRAVHYVGEDAWLKYLSSNTALNRAIQKDEALTLSSVWRGVNVLANTVAALPIKVYKKLDEGGKEVFVKHPLYKLLRFKPNELQDRMQFFQMMVGHLVLRGNYYAQKIRNGRLEVVELYPLNPDCVRPVWKKEGDDSSLIYQVSLPSGKNYELTREQMFHVRAFSVEGITGLNALTQANQSVGVGLAQEEHTAAFFGRGTRATGVLTHPNKITEDAARRIRESFQANFSGSENAYKTILLEENMTWTQVSMNAEQSQLLQNREMTVSEFSRWLGVPPHMLYDLRRATFSNIEQQNLEFYQNSIQPWLSTIECAIERQILREDEWDKVIVEFIVDGILRSDTLARYQAYNIGRNGGWLNVDEIRAKDNLNPLKGGKGQIYLEPLNMKEVGTDPEPKKDEPAPTGGDSETKSWAQVFQNRIERAMRREETMRERGKLDEAKFSEYVQSDFSGDVGAYLLYRSGKEKILDIDKSTERILKRFSSKWPRASIIEVTDTHEGKCKLQLRRLMFLINSEIEWQESYEHQD